MTRPRAAVVLLALAAVVVLVGLGVTAGRDGEPAGPGGRGERPAAAPAQSQEPSPDAAPAARGSPDDPPFATAVSPDGRYLVDQRGEPFLVRGDSPWSLLTDLTPDEQRHYLQTRAGQGFNAVLTALLGAVANGAPSDDGATVDGLHPFVDGDVTRLDDAYWDRVVATAETARRLGLTLFLYPVDGWSVGKAFSPGGPDDCRAYGRAVAERFAGLPNVVWVMGGDYFPQTDDPAAGSDVDRCMDAALGGIRDAGDRRPFSVQLGYDVSRSTDNPFWAPRVDWVFAYSYYPTYRAVLDARATAPARPVVFGEGNYEGENNQAETAPTTPETLRRQVLWAMTSGAAGDFFGTDDWELLPGWQDRLGSPGVRAVTVARDVLAGLRWWELVPDGGPATVDGGRALVESGRGRPVLDDAPGDVLDDDYVTAAATPDGAQAAVYVPTARTVRLDLGLLRPGVVATWVDPSSGARHAAGSGPDFTTPGRNADGASDWLLVLR